MDKLNHIRRIFAFLLSLLLCATIVFSSPLSQDLKRTSGRFSVYSYAFSTDTSTNIDGSSKEDSIKRATVIYDYPVVINKSYKKTVKISAIVTPAKGGRKVRLQRYNSTTGDWRTVKTATTKSAKNARVSFTIPKKQRKKTTSVWRLYVPSTKKAEEATSENITLTTRNIKSYKLTAKAACVYRIDGNGTGTLIYTKNSDTKRAQASTTKLMTAVLLLESGKLNTTTTISSHAASTPWSAGKLKKGDIYSTHDLLYAMLLPSANDAATAVAERVGGTEANFVSMMNAKANAMGWTKTHFCNPHGLDANGHYTTAVELAKLTAYAYTFPEIRECWTTKSKTIKALNGKKKKWSLWSTNSLFGYVSNFLGGKTGTEDNAGCCFTGVYTYGGSTYVTVVLGSGYGFSRWSDTKKLHSYITKYAAGKY